MYKKIKVEGVTYGVVDIIQEAIGNRNIQGHVDIIGYGVKIYTREQPIFSELTPNIEQITGLDDNLFKKWLMNTKVYSGNKCMICIELFRGYIGV